VPFVAVIRHTDATFTRDELTVSIDFVLTQLHCLSRIATLRFCMETIYISPGFQIPDL